MKILGITFTTLMLSWEIQIGKLTFEIKRL